MAATGFRISCDLSDFFCDIRKKSFLYVDLSKYHIIKDLIIYIQDTFNLKNLLLSINDSYLPDFEDIRIIHDNDEIKVFRKVFTTLVEGICENEDMAVGNEGEATSPRVTKKSRRKKKRDKIDDAVNVETAVASTSSGLRTSYMIDNNVYTCEAKILKEKKGKRVRINQEEQVTDNNNVIVSVGEIQPQFVFATQIELKNDSPNAELVHDLPANKHKLCADDESADGEIKSPAKRKRKRVRTRRKRTENVEHKVENTYSSLTYTHSTPIMKPGAPTATSNSVHVRFPNGLSMEHAHDDINSFGAVGALPKSKQNGYATSGNAYFTSGSEAVERVVPECAASSTNNLATDIYRINNHSAPYEDNNSTEVAFGKILALRNAAPIVVKRTKPLTPSTTSNDVKLTPSVLQRIPIVNELITFKILKLDDNYCPLMSESVTAKVLNCEMGTQQLTLKILAGQDQCQQPQGKFSIDIDTENVPELVDIVEYNWQELLEPCLLSVQAQ